MGAAGDARPCDGPDHGGGGGQLPALDRARRPAHPAPRQAPLFPLTGAMLGAAILGALSQREFRAFGVTLAPDTPEGLTPDPAAS